MGFGRSYFCQFLRTADAPLLRAMLRDRRLATLDSTTLMQLGRASNAVAGHPVVDEAELMQLQRAESAGDGEAVRRRICAALSSYASR